MASAHIVDVGDHDFEARVLGESGRRPVVVDFWAPWCGPCRALTPVLERLAEEGQGKWLLAKVNTDQHPRFAQQYFVRGIPAVKAFRGGEVVNEFTGALPEEMVRTWLERVVPTAGQEEAERAAALLLQGDLDGADQAAADVLEREPRVAAALLVRAQVALARKDPDAAQAFLDAVMDAGVLEAEVDRARAKVVLIRATAAGDDGVLRARLSANGKDGDAAVGVAAYEALAGDTEAAFARVLEVIGRGGDAKKHAHEVALAVLALVPGEMQREMRRRLSMALF